MSILNNLPDVEFASKDISKIQTDIITTYEAISGRKLAPGDPVRLFLQAIASIIAQQRVLIDYSAKQNLLAYASGDFLDHIGVRLNTDRMPAQAAQTIIRFTIASQPQTVTIPKGTRVTPDGKIFFATTDVVDVPSGTTQVDITAECTTAGTIGNDWEPGQINRLVDPLPWVTKVENITTSSGGTDTEDDDSYRERIRKAPERYSVAGPYGAYDYWARTAHQSIIDVSVSSPSPGQVEIRPLLEGGEIPSQEILDTVDAVCNDRNIRPLTDLVTVLAPTVVNYDITLTYWIDESNSSIAASIQEAVNEAIDEYVTWQKSKLGRDVNPSKLTARIINAGAKRVEIIVPIYTAITKDQVAVANNITVTYGGLEDE